MISNLESMDGLVPAAILEPEQYDSISKIDSNYTKFGESFRHNTPNEVQCSMFCGGRRCKYESSFNWRPEDMAIDGIYSHWITDDFLAMARPNSDGLEKLIGQFHKYGIKSVVNLQTPGEHSSCGRRLLPSGFSYDPNIFMSNNISFYNFAWKDHSETSTSNLLDMVKVIAFATTEGKVAVHCHAGLGRTGVLASAYLIYNLRVRANDAISFVRRKRPGSVQTRRQIRCVKDFEMFFLPQCLVFSNVDERNSSFTVDQYLRRQRLVLHGQEARILKHLPKLLFLICERLLAISNCDLVFDLKSGDNFTTGYFAFGVDGKLSRTYSRSTSSSSDSTIPGNGSSDRWSSLSESTCTDDENTEVIFNDGNEVRSDSSSSKHKSDGFDIIQAKQDEEKISQDKLNHKDDIPPKVDVTEIIFALVDSHFNHSSVGFNHTNIHLLHEYQSSLNYKLSTWEKINSESNVWVLTAMIFQWMEQLKLPILDMEGVMILKDHSKDIPLALTLLPVNVSFIIEYLVGFVVRLRGTSKMDIRRILLRLIAYLTQTRTLANKSIYPSRKNLPLMEDNETDSLVEFFLVLFEVVSEKLGMNLS